MVKNVRRKAAAVAVAVAASAAGMLATAGSASASMRPFETVWVVDRATEITACSGTVTAFVGPFWASVRITQGCALRIDNAEYDVDSFKVIDDNGEEHRIWDVDTTTGRIDVAIV